MIKREIDEEGPVFSANKEQVLDKIKRAANFHRRDQIPTLFKNCYAFRMETLFLVFHLWGCSPVNCI
jgi:hypothetical protein